MKTLIIILALLASISLQSAVAQEATKIHVDPALNSFPPEMEFTVNVKVDNVIGLNAWGFKLRWDPEILKLVQVEEGDFLNSSGSTYFIANEFVDYVAVGCWLRENIVVSGSGVLANVTFKVMKAGACDLILYDTQLLDINVVEMPHVTENAIFIYSHIPLAIEPETLNLRSNGKWITAYIEDKDVEKVDLESIKLFLWWATRIYSVSVIPKIAEIGDYDNDEVPDLAVKFNRQEVIQGIEKIKAGSFVYVTLWATLNAEMFEAHTTLLIIR